jgi:hypothetical protein
MWPPGGLSSRQPAAHRADVARCRAARFEPATGVSRLLLGQGIGWLLLSVGGLAGWSASFPRGLSLSGGDAVFWAGLELLAIAIAAGFGAAEVGMACRMRGGPRLVVAMTGKLQGTMLAVALILAAVLVMIGGSLLELMALGKLVPGVAPGGNPSAERHRPLSDRLLRRVTQPDKSPSTAVAAPETAVAAPKTAVAAPETAVAAPDRCRGNDTQIPQPSEQPPICLICPCGRGRAAYCSGTSVAAGRW